MALAAPALPAPAQPGLGLQAPAQPALPAPAPAPALPAPALAAPALPAHALAATASRPVPGRARSEVASGVGAPTAIHRDEFLTRRQVRGALDFSRPLATFAIAPTDQHPIPDPDCATTGRPEATQAVVYPAARSRIQFFEYTVPGQPWTIQGRVLVLEYGSRAKARAAMARVRASVRSTTGYALVCEGINPSVSGQRAVRSPAVEGRSFAWRYHLTAVNAGSYRDIVSTKGRRLVWVELGRVNRAELDWSKGTPSTTHPRYPSRAFLASLAKPAIAKAL